MSRTDIPFYAILLALFAYGVPFDHELVATILACMVIDMIIFCVNKQGDKPFIVLLNVSFRSRSHKHTKNYAYTLAQVIFQNFLEGKRTVITLTSKNRGAGKTTLVSAVLKCFSNMVRDSGSLSFTAVKQYTFIINGKEIKFVHVDPDCRGSVKLCNLHDADWNVLFFEHGQHSAFKQYKDQILDLGEEVIHYNIDIVDNDDHREFTMTSVSGGPIVTPSPITLTGKLVEYVSSPDIHLIRRQVKYLKKKFGKILVIMSIETSCDDTCIIIKMGDKIIYFLQKLCHQGKQEQGKVGIDPKVMAKRHAENLAKAKEDILEILQNLGLKVDIVSVTQGPGQADALVEGISFAQEMALYFGAPIMYLDHIKGHAISARIPTLPTPECPSPEAPPEYPYLVFVVSGGHTVLLLVKSAVDMQIVYTTPNDAIGEMFDKVCRAMGIPCVPAGPMAEDLMKAFKVPQEYWTEITAKTEDKAIKAFPVEHQGTLKRFRDVLIALDKCLTPSDIKRMFCKLIKELKLRNCNRKKLLAVYLKKFYKGTLCRDNLMKLSGVCKWNMDVDGPIDEFIAELQNYQLDGEFVELVQKCVRLRLKTTLEHFLEKHKEIKLSPAFLKAFLLHFDDLDDVTVEDIANLCGASITTKQKMEGEPSDILDAMRGADTDMHYMHLLEQVPLFELPFDTFVREYEAMTPLPMDEQQFFCACLHSVTLRYLDCHLQQAVATFPDIKDICLTGGVACNRFLQHFLKLRIQKNGRRFIVTPVKLCPDNPIMMWQLTVETLKYVFDSVGPCVGREDDEHDAHCESCKQASELLFKQGCGCLNTPVQKSAIQHHAGERWDNNANYKFVKHVPSKPSECVSQEKYEPDKDIDPDLMWKAMLSKNNAHDQPIGLMLAAYTKGWKAKVQKRPIYIYIISNQEMLEKKFTNKLKRQTLLCLLSTNFFGHGYKAFKAAKPEDLAPKAYNPIEDCETFFKLLPQGLVPSQ
jgi:glycoprotease/Kae1 family metallohydrolase